MHPITHEFRDPPLRETETAMQWRGCNAEQAARLRCAGFEVRRVYRIDAVGCEGVGWREATFAKAVKG